MKVTIDVMSGGRRANRLRLFVWGTAAALLLLPAVAMRFTTEVNWDETDFIVMGLLLTAACGGYEVATRLSGDIFYRAGAGVAILISFLTIWANLAVGMIGSEDNPYNLLFLGVIVLALAGGALARFRAAGMVRAMAAAAGAQVLIAAAGLTADPRGGVFSLLFAMPWLVSAALFAGAARAEGRRAGA